MQISGVNVAAVTPHRSDGREIDFAAALELIDFFSNAGLKGIAVLGSTGEFTHFSREDRARLVEMSVKRSRLPIIAGVSDASFGGAVEMARASIDAGAAALLLMPPYFFRYSQAIIKEFFLRFRTEVGGSVPIFLYNIPFFTTEIAIETALDLLATGQFAGIKDSSGEFGYFERLQALRARVPFTILVGNDIIYAKARRRGADGGVSGCACAVPELMLGLDDAIRADSTHQVARLTARLAEFIHWLDRFPVPIGIKEAIAVRGLKVGPLSLPLPAEKQKLLDEFREWFGGWWRIVKKETLQT